MGNFVDDNMKTYTGINESWDILDKKIEEGTPFCYVRFNEGESRMVANIPGRLTRSTKLEKQKAKGNCTITKYGPGHKRKFGRWSYNEQKDKDFLRMMRESLLEEGDNYFASCCEDPGYINYRYQVLLLMEEGMKNLPKQVLSAHMPHSKGVHRKMFDCFKKHQPKCQLIVNEKGNVDNLPFKFGNVWRVANEEAHRKNMDLVDKISDTIEKEGIRNNLFLCCAGPFSNILLHQIWKRQPNNFYLDIGSTLDYYMFNSPTRGWLNKMGYPQKPRGKDLR